MIMIPRIFMSGIKDSVRVCSSQLGTLSTLTCYSRTGREGLGGVTARCSCAKLVRRAK